MRKWIIAGGILLLCNLLPISAGAEPKPVFSGHIIAENMNAIGYPAQFLGTVRLGMDMDLSQYSFVHLRGVVDQIDLNNCGLPVRSGIDQGHIGFRFKNGEVRLGKQWLYFGKGLLADVNVNRVAQVTATADNVKLTTVVGKDLTIAEIGVTGKVTNFGISYKDAGPNISQAYRNEGISDVYGNPSGYDDRSWAVFCDTRVFNNGRWSFVYVRNNNEQTGYMTEVKKGQYALSYRNVEARAINADWATSA
ncbi:MAG TPA: hypothetical protein VN611_17195, partial [Patescibacteria group bacterium]|nr:hypothetical protein [Patescibacteria group bacterium]